MSGVIFSSSRIETMFFERARPSRRVIGPA
jgi:hypothetical protein